MQTVQSNQQYRQLQQSSQLFRVFFSTLEQMALARYEWTGLPETISSDDIERLLFVNGTASIAALPDADGKPIESMAYLMPYAQIGMTDIYGYPIKWRTVAPAPAQNYEANQQTGVCIFANMSIPRMFPFFMVSDFGKCMEFAGELEDIALARRTNRNATKTPYILKVPRQLENTARAILNKIEGNDNVIGTDDIAELVKIEVLNTDVKFLTEEYNADERSIWNRAYAALGISNLPFKQERMIEDEVLAQDESVNLVELSNLKERRRAAAHLNTLFGWDVAVHPSRVPYPPNIEDLHMGDDTATDSEMMPL